MTRHITPRARRLVAERTAVFARPRNGLTEVQERTVRKLWLADEPVRVIAERTGRSDTAVRSFARRDPECVAHQRPQREPESVGAQRKQMWRGRHSEGCPARNGKACDCGGQHG